ncbi:FkbM family methyltransferase [Ekhidna sp.]|uniref:FkbM family methyltransferase n=1 Tax=Ekhidna sp. TaxID=2608089 RepID=UPI00351544C4
MGLKNLLIGRKWLQPVYERLFRISLRGMNYGMAAFVESSGELNLIRSLPSILQRDSLVIFDVGSNDGDYASHLVNEIGSHHKLHFFEPSPEAFSALTKRLKSVDVDKVRLNNFGLSSEAKIAPLYFDQKGTGWASIHKISHPHLGVNLDQSEEIQLKTLDKYCQENGVEEIDFLKMDVEGHEKEVLLGAKEMIEAGKIKCIQFEFGIAHLISKVFLREFFDILRDYNIYRVLQDGIYKITYNERYEVFMNSNYFALKKRI